MPMTVNVQGADHEIVTVHVKVNDEWRPSEIAWTKVEDQWREAYSFETLTEADILGFKIYYRKHFEAFTIPYNPNLDASFLPTGSTPFTLDTTPKGVIYRYERQHPSNEGYQLYEGRIYAMTRSGMLLDVARTHHGTSLQNKRIHYDDIGDVWETNQLQDMEIIVDGEQTYDDVGYFFAGWNRFFRTADHISRRVYPDKDRHHQTLYLSIPLVDCSFKMAWIGVRYDTHSFDPDMGENNMVGASGYMDQTISQITVDGVQKPFSLQIL